MGCGRRPVGASVLVERYLRIVRFWTVWTVLRHVPARVLMCPEVNLLEPSHRVMPMATPAPGWVSYAALIVACVAALTPIVSARISYLSYRSSRPRIRLKIQYRSKDPASNRVVMGFTVVNEGRGDVNIVSFHVTPYGERKPVILIKNTAFVIPVPPPAPSAVACHHDMRSGLQRSVCTELPIPSLGGERRARSAWRRPRR